MQVLANLAIVLITPEGGRGRYSRSCFTHLIPGGQERNVLSPKTQLALLWKLPNTSGRRKAPQAASPGKDLQARALGLTAPATGRGRRRREALSLPAPGKRAPAARQAQPSSGPASPALANSRLKWLRQARSTILARNRMTAPALLRSTARRHWHDRGQARVGVNQGSAEGGAIASALCCAGRGPRQGPGAAVQIALAA